MPGTLFRRSVRFGSFEADLLAGRLRKDGQRVLLHEQPLHILKMLLENPGEVVTREEMQRALWPGSSFGDLEDSLNHAIRRLRDALGDSADDPRLIETVPRRGYRFIAPVTPVPQPTDDAAAIHDRRTEAAFTKRRYSRWFVTLAAAGVVTAIVAALLVLNIAGLRDRITRRNPPMSRIEAIAVLPLENLSGEPAQEYFADGATEELITNLGKIGALRVISRTSVMRYKGTRKPLPEIARELDVDAIVEGSVRRSGNRVRISANLLHAHTDRHLWAESYERDLGEILTLQSEVARAIARAVKIAVTAEEHGRLGTSHPVNPVAYEAYLKAKYAFGQGAGPTTVLQSLREAVAADPGYAQPYVGLALAYIQMGFGTGALSPQEAFAHARQAALRALQLDGTLGEAHSCLGWVRAFSEWEWAAAERDFRRGIEIGPNSVETHQMYSWYLSATGRHEQAIAESLRARDLDPVSPQANDAVASAYWWARQYERFAAESEKLAAMDPTFLKASQLLGLAHLQAGSYDKAIRRFEAAIALREKDPPAFLVALLGCAHGRAGNRAEALKVLDELDSRSKHSYVSPYLVALVHANMGDKDQAFLWLEKAYAERNPMLTFLNVDGVIDPLRPDPRFDSLLRRMHLPR